MKEVFIVAANRTPFGRFGGTLKELTAAIGYWILDTEE